MIQIHGVPCLATLLLKSCLRACCEGLRQGLGLAHWCATQNPEQAFKTPSDTGLAHDPERAHSRAKRAAACCHGAMKRRELASESEDEEEAQGEEALREEEQDEEQNDHADQLPPPSGSVKTEGGAGAKRQRRRVLNAACRPLSMQQRPHGMALCQMTLITKSWLCSSM